MRFDASVIIGNMGESLDFGERDGDGDGISNAVVDEDRYGSVCEQLGEVSFVGMVGSRSGVTRGLDTEIDGTTVASRSLEDGAGIAH